MYNKITNSENVFQIINPTKRSKIMNKEELIRTLAAHAATLSSCLKKSGPTTHFPPSSAIVSMQAITSSRTAVL